MAMISSQVSVAAPGVQTLHREAARGVDGIPCKRVAAYCRVSTDKEIQQTSLAIQEEAFRALITSHPGWELAGIYADEGMSGTSAKKRAAFQRMIADCEAGKIDYIVTKSISRFARNTLDCLQYVRMLKDLGVYVLFEDNNLDTASSSSEMLLSILAAVAQEESHSISENMKWGVRKRFAEGKPKWSPTYGYIKDDDGSYLVNEKEAVVVRRIFQMYSEGKSLPQIADALNVDGVPTAKDYQWWPKTLGVILRNEKYVGDVLMQKSYTVDFLTHKKVVNDQETVPSYLVREHHEAIVDRNTFDMVQTILSMKDKNQGCVQYPYYGTLICPLCGAKMVAFRLPVRKYPEAWTCGGERHGVVEIDPLLSGVSDEESISRKSSCQHYIIRKKYIDRALCEAFIGLNVEELEDWAKINSNFGRAAKKALEWKKKDSSLASIEYIFLNDLVESITFRLSGKRKVLWNEVVITWKFGSKSNVLVQYDRPADLPYTVKDTKDFYWIENANRHNESIRACCQHVRGQDGRPRRFVGAERTVTL